MARAAKAAQASEIRLSEEEVGDLLRYHFDEKVPWAQLAEDEGCDGPTLERAVQRWSGGDLIIRPKPRGLDGEAAAPGDDFGDEVDGATEEDARDEEGAAQVSVSGHGDAGGSKHRPWDDEPEQAQRPSYLRRLAKSEGVNLREAARIHRDMRAAQAKSEEQAMMAMVGRALGGVDIHDESIPVDVRRSAILGASRVFHLHGVGSRRAALLLGYPKGREPALMMSAWVQAGHEHRMKQPKGSKGRMDRRWFQVCNRLKGELLALIGQAGAPVCCFCLGGCVEAPQSDVTSALRALREESFILEAAACSQCVRTELVHREKIWTLNPHRNGVWMDGQEG